MAGIADRKLSYIPISKVRTNPSALREVNRSSEKYVNLVDSIKNVGVLKPILVHETTDKDTGEIIYGLSDGLHRFTGAQDAGLDQIPAHIVPLDESQVLLTQIIANVQTIETKPAEYSAALLRVMGEHPTMTINDLAEKLNKSPTWLSSRLSLVKLTEGLQAVVNEGKMNLTNAYALAKLPEDEQAGFADRAMTEAPDVFVPTINSRVKQIREDKRKGREASPEQFVPVPHLQKLGDLRDELASKRIANTLRGKGVITDVDSFAMGVAWSLHLDPDSISAAEIKFAQKQEEKKAAKEKRAHEKDESKAQEAAETLKRLGITVPELPEHLKKPEETATA